MFHEGKIDRCEAGDTSSATTLGQVPPEVAVALLDLIETPSEATWIDGVRGSDTFSMAADAVLGSDSLEPNELGR